MSDKLYTAEKGVELLQAKRLVMARFDMTEEEWINEMVELGCRFAESFSRLFPNQRTVRETLLKKDDPVTKRYWQWWQFKFMEDDLQFVQSSVYYEPITYAELKEAMIGEEILETDLLSYMEGKLIS